MCPSTWGGKETILTEVKGLFDKHPVAHLLDPNCRRAEEGKGSEGSKPSRELGGTARQHGFGARQVVSWRANS